MAEETLTEQAAGRLIDVLRRQPPWSDLPIIVSAVEGSQAAAALGQHGNVSMVERPVRALAMIRAVQSALRSRTRQYGARSLLEQLGASREEAEAVSRSKDEFLATISHELRTPLNAILGWARMLTTGRLEEGKHPRALQAIERNAVAQAQLIEDLLDVSRIVSGKLRLDLEPTDLRRVADAAVDAVRPAIDAKEIRFTAVVDPALGQVMGDPNRLQQVVWNLLANAIKFTPKGGQVRLTLSGIDGHTELSVTDDGQGIERAFLPLVFQRFQQAETGTTRLQGGLGLGLAICRHLVELHGGTIEALSEGLGRGATFRFRLPLLPYRVSSDARRVASAMAPRGKFERPSELVGLTVLVIDDQADTREVLASILAACGATVHEEASARAGLATLRAARPDVVVSDIGMPEEDGYSFIQRVRALPPEEGGTIPAAALTAYARAEDRRKALTMGFEMHIPKPVEPDELVAAVATLARIGRALK